MLVSASAISPTHRMRTAVVPSAAYSAPMARSSPGASTNIAVAAEATMTRVWRRVAAADRVSVDRSALARAKRPVATAGETRPTIEVSCHAAPKAAAWTGRPTAARTSGRAMGGVWPRTLMP